MAEGQTSEPEKRSAAWWRERISAALLGQFQLPGWLLLLIAIVIGVPDWHSRYEFWLSTALSVGNHISVVAAILLWPYFSPMLATVAILYLVGVSRFQNRVMRHPAVAIAAWICVGLCLVAIVLTAGLGATEIYIRREVAKGIAGLPRGTPDEAAPGRPQSSPYISNWGAFQPDQIRILLVEVPRLKPILPSTVWITVAPAGDTGSYASQFQEILVRSGIQPGLRSQNPRGPEEEGLMLAVRDLDNITTAAQKVREAFEIANIHLKLVRLSDDMKQADSALEFAVFVGPRPVRR
jgi:hypothetical protein